MTSATLGFQSNDNSASHSPCILMGQMQRKLSKSWRKNGKKLSKTNEKTLPRGKGTTLSGVTIDSVPTVATEGINV